MSKIIAMIPARLGSKRVPKKNLRYLGEKPLITYIIEAAQESKVFDEIYVNTESDEIGEYARKCGVKYYKRPESLSSDKTINDEFTLDFMENVKGDILIQLLPTSPFISPEEISQFVKKMMDSRVDTLVSVVDHQIACVYENQGVNFSRTEPHRSSQTMTPVRSYATVLMGWTYESFLKNMKKFGYAYHGPSGEVGYFPLKGISTIDIDNEEDFDLAEAALGYFEKKSSKPKRYYESNRHSEVDVPAILKIDGVVQSDFTKENMSIVALEKLIASKDNTRSWCHRLVNTENNSATLISQLPGEGNRLHYHPDWNEWWYIVEGKWIWEIEGKEFEVKKGDVVFIEKGKWHKITATGNSPAIRLAVSKDKVPHIYKEDVTNGS